MARRKKQPTSDAGALPDAGNVVVHNTQPRAIFLPSCVVDGKRYDQRMLVPGQNDVPVEQWRHVAVDHARAGMKLMTTMGYLECLGGGRAEPMPSGLDGMADDDARDRLAAIDDPQALIELRDLTSSTALVRLANERLRELTEAEGGPDKD